MSILGGLISAYGAQRAKKEAGYRPRYTKQYETLKYQDISSLYGPGAYEQPGLGYTEQEMEGKFGEGRDLLAGEAAGEQQRVADRFRSPGGLGLRSAMFQRAMQRSDLARVARANELRRRMVVENAAQKRADKMARIAAVTGAFETAANLYNQRAAARRGLQLKKYAGLAEAGATAEKYATMGFGGMMGG